MTVKARRIVRTLETEGTRRYGGAIGSILPFRFLPSAVEPMADTTLYPKGSSVFRWGREAPWGCRGSGLD